jgi:hypothetical protein
MRRPRVPVSNVGTVRTCANGHLMTADERFCLQCGAPAIEDEGRPAGLMPPFDPERLRPEGRDAESEAPGRTVPMWLLVLVIVLGLAAGIVIGAVK